MRNYKYHRYSILKVLALVMFAGLRVHGNVVATLSTDNGSGTTSGTLSYAILQGGPSRSRMESLPSLFREIFLPLRKMRRSIRAERR
jgi:hypothetical protein